MLAKSKANKRGEKKARWAIFFPFGKGSAKLRAWKQALQQVLDSGNAKIKMDVAPAASASVILVWPHPVTVYSAYGLVQKAQKQDPSLETLGMPRAVDDPPVEDPPVEEAAPAENPPKRRCMGKKASKEALPATAVISATATSAISATATVPPAAPATVPAVSAIAIDSAASATAIVSAASATATAPAAALEFFPDSHLLSLKLEHVCIRLQHPELEAEPTAYSIDWKKPLGRGDVGRVYACHARNVPTPLAIKICDDNKEQMMEVIRFSAVQGLPCLIKLLDVIYVNGGPGLHQRPSCGMVFERFDSDARQFMNIQHFKTAGIRHILRCVATALEHMHQRGIAHADLKPANILLRGTASFQDGWRRLLEPASGAAADSGSAAASASGAAAASASAAAIPRERAEVTYQVPALFEVRGVETRIPLPHLQFQPPPVETFTPHFKFQPPPVETFTPHPKFQPPPVETFTPPPKVSTTPG